jgi:putative ABC transport system ATP-binding protein
MICLNKIKIFKEELVVSNKLIEFKNVSKTYVVGELKIRAVDGVSFTIDEGELVVILGASGAGKTTILNMLGGMDGATGGEIVIGGENIAAYNDKRLTDYRRLSVGFVFQFYNLITNLNALENVEFAAETCKNHLDAKEILGVVGLSERLKNFPAQLSGGEQQRVAIARAVAKNPLLLLCDEPTGALDYVTSKAVLRLLTDVNEKYGKTVVVITHNNALAAMADKVIKVRSGKIDAVVMNESKTPIEEIEW